MPSYIIVQSASHKPGVSIDAILQEYPNRGSDTPVKVTISEKTLRLDDEPYSRPIISAIGESGATTYLIGGSPTSVKNRERRAALARAQSVLEHLRSHLMPLKESSTEPEYVVQALQMLFDWLREERERLSGL